MYKRPDILNSEICEFYSNYFSVNFFMLAIGDFIFLEEENYTSLMSGGKLIHYGSLEQGLDASAKVLHDKYLTPGGSFYHGATISGVARCYCPESSWPGLVFGRMKQIVK